MWRYEPSLTCLTYLAGSRTIIFNSWLAEDVEQVHFYRNVFTTWLSSRTKLRILYSRWILVLVPIHLVRPMLTAWKMTDGFKPWGRPSPLCVLHERFSRKRGVKMKDIPWRLTKWSQQRLVSSTKLLDERKWTREQKLSSKLLVKLSKNGRKTSFLNSLRENIWVVSWYNFRCLD